jgi:type I restriction enzyme R subunit
MGMSEAETRAKLIDPKIKAGGWSEDLIEREYLYRKGRVRLIGEQTVRDTPQYADYVLRDKPKGLILAVLEAKEEDRSPGHGLQQALAYAEDLAVRFAYSSNGHEFVEQDRAAGVVTEHLTSVPSPEELLARIQAQDTMRGPTVANRRGEQVANPMIEPAYSAPGVGEPRYYQERAITAAIDQMLLGRHRALLSLATGTGKTFIAFNLAWKLMRSGWSKRVLFLADRVNLAAQAYNEFAPFGDARGMIAGALPMQRDVHFGIYQGLYVMGAGGKRLYEQYPADYFDVVIIDECHRSGYGDWSAILDHFESAFHLGLTATPKRTDSIDTYEFFGGENRDGDNQPQSAYEYSLGKGIDDGFLATYRVYQVKMNVDQQGLHIVNELAKGAELIVPEGGDIQDAYTMAEFEREIVVPDRTKAMCEHLAAKLRTWGATQKTIIFCVTMEHAELVRTTMQNLLGPETGKNLYAVRIVSEERDAQATLREFQSSTSTQPLLATTVDLLTTGVNVPSVRNIVFMKLVGSPTIFKQIIGRGSRIDATTGKEFFRIIDYTNATRLFDEWDLPSAGTDPDQPTTGEEAVEGRVLDSEAQATIEGAVVVARLGTRTLRETTTDAYGGFGFDGLPAAPITLIVAASGYTRRTTKVQPAQPPPQVDVELRQPTEGAEKAADRRRRGDHRRGNATDPRRRGHTVRRGVPGLCGGTGPHGGWGRGHANRTVARSGQAPDAARAPSRAEGRSGDPRRVAQAARCG